MIGQIAAFIVLYAIGYLIPFSVVFAVVNDRRSLLGFFIIAQPTIFATMAFYILKINGLLGG